MEDVKSLVKEIRQHLAKIHVCLAQIEQGRKQNMAVSVKVDKHGR